MNIISKLPGPLLILFGAFCLGFGGLIVKSFVTLEVFVCIFSLFFCKELFNSSADAIIARNSFAISMIKCKKRGFNVYFICVLLYLYLYTCVDVYQYTVMFDIYKILNILCFSVSSSFCCVLLCNLCLCVSSGFEVWFVLDLESIQHVLQNKTL